MTALTESTQTATPRKARRLLLRLSVSSVVCALLLAFVEGGVRVLGPRLGLDREEITKLRQYASKGHPGVYSPQPYYGFSRSIELTSSNSWGFGGDEWTVERTPGVLRIACLGGSTTESGNQRGYKGSYPYFLGKALEKHTGRQIEIMNCGISMWTSNESVAAWFVLLKDFRPDLVIFHHAANDVEPRNMQGFRTDYVHFRKTWESPRYGVLERLLLRCSDAYAWLVAEKRPPTLRSLTKHEGSGRSVHREEGALASETARAFVRNILSIAADVRSQGGEMMLMTMPTDPNYGKDKERHAGVFEIGIPEHNQIMRELAQEHGFLLADAAAGFEADSERVAPYFRDFVHVEPEGNLGKAVIAASVLKDAWAPLSATPPETDDSSSGH